MRFSCYYLFYLSIINDNNRHNEVIFFNVYTIVEPMFVDGGISFFAYNIRDLN